MTINNRGLSGQPTLPYIDYRSYQGADIFIDLTFLDHTGALVTPSQVTYRIDDMTNAVPMLNSTALTNTKASGTGSIGFSGTGSVSADVLTISTVTAGIINPADVLVLTGLPAGTTVLAQITGTTGGVGTYRINYPVITPLSLSAFTATSNILYVTAMTYGAFAPGDQLINSQFGSIVIESLATNPNPAVLTGTLWLLQGNDPGTFAGSLSVTSNLPSTYTLQIPSSVLQMTHNWQGSQICQILLASTWVDPVTNQSATTQGVAVLELIAIQTPNGAL
jgi:hypothetical protein